MPPNAYYLKSDLTKIISNIFLAHIKDRGFFIQNFKFSKLFYEKFQGMTLYL